LLPGYSLIILLVVWASFGKGLVSGLSQSKVNLELNSSSNIGPEDRQCHWNISGTEACLVSLGGKYSVEWGGIRSEQYDYVYGPVDVGGKPAYVASLDHKQFVVWGDEKLGMEYSSIEGTTLESVGGKPAFIVYRKDGKQVVVYDGKEYGEEYDDVKIASISIFDIGGKLAYLALKNNLTYLVLEGQIVGRGYARIYPPVTSVNGSLLFAASDTEPEQICYSHEDCMMVPTKVFLVYGDQEIGKQFGSVHIWCLGACTNPPARVVKGILLYVAENESKYYLVYGETIVGEGKPSPDLKEFESFAG
jgi:hypothetical protein